MNMTGGFHTKTCLYLPLACMKTSSSTLVKQIYTFFFSPVVIMNRVKTCRKKGISYLIQLIELTKSARVQGQTLFLDYPPGLIYFVYEECI